MNDYTICRLPRLTRAEFNNPHISKQIYGIDWRFECSVVKYSTFFYLESCDINTGTPLTSLVVHVINICSGIASFAVHNVVELIQVL